MEENTDDEGVENELEGSDMALEETAVSVQSAKSMPESHERCSVAGVSILELEMGEAASTLSAQPLEMERAFSFGEQITPVHQEADSVKDSAKGPGDKEGQVLEETPLEAFPSNPHELSPSVISEEPTVDGIKVLHI